MKPIALVFAVLFLPLTSEATTKQYSRGYVETWCADLTKTLPDGTVVLAADPNNPQAVKGYCYGVATTPKSVHPVMTGMKTRSRITVTGPTGIQVNKESGLVLGGSSAKVQIPYYTYDGNFTFWSEVGEVFCPAGQMTKASIFGSSKKKLGVSTICARVDSPSWRTSCKPVIDPIFKKQLGWNCGYFPKDPCQVKCVAQHYILYVVSPGGTIIPADSGTFHKGFSIDVDTGVLTCTGFLVSFTPDGIPGILPCKSCKEDIIFGP